MLPGTTLSVTEWSTSMSEEPEDTPAFGAGVTIMDTIDPELYRRLGELFGQPAKEQP